MIKYIGIKGLNASQRFTGLPISGVTFVNKETVLELNGCGLEAF
jgi:hypothetical protein